MGNENNYRGEVELQLGFFDCIGILAKYCWGSILRRNLDKYEWPRPYPPMLEKNFEDLPPMENVPRKMQQAIIKMVQTEVRTYMIWAKVLFKDVPSANLVTILAAIQSAYSTAATLIIQQVVDCTGYPDLESEATRARTAEAHCQIAKAFRTFAAASGESSRTIEALSSFADFFEDVVNHTVRILTWSDMGMTWPQYLAGLTSSIGAKKAASEAAYGIMSLRMAMKSALDESKEVQVSSCCGKEMSPADDVVWEQVDMSTSE